MYTKLITIKVPPLNKPKTFKNEIEKFILITEKQTASNNVLYSLKEGLNALYLIIIESKTITKEFFTKWKSIIGFAYRAFEGHPFLDDLYSIDKAIIKYYKAGDISIN
jgi:hypothetical protein